MPDYGLAFVSPAGEMGAVKFLDFVALEFEGWRKQAVFNGPRFGDDDKELQPFMCVQGGIQLIQMLSQ